MRLLFSAPPGLSHLYPLVPLAHAARTSGHEVLIATGGVAVAGARGAGLHVVDVAPGRPVDAPYEQLACTVVTTDLPPEQLIREVGARFGEMSQLMLPGLVSACREWGADAVVYPPAFPAGLLAARICGIRSVLHGFGLRRPTFMPAMQHLDEAARNWNITTLPTEPDLEINISPPSVQAASTTPDSVQTTTTAETLHMRYLPDSGSAELPPWLIAPADRPRIVVSLGTQPSTVGAGEVLGAIVRGIRQLEVDLVLLSVCKDLPGLPRPLPENVRFLEWMPLPVLISNSSVLVHHGGMGSMFGAFAGGIPQVVIPHGGDRTYNARVVEKCGVGVAIPPDDMTEERIGQSFRCIFELPDYRDAGRAIAQEMARMQSPHEVVSRMTEIIG